MIAAYCYFARAQYPEYVAEFQEAMAINESGRRYADEAGKVFRKTGIKGLQRWMIENIEEGSNQPYNNPYYKATLYALLGDKDKSIEWMKKAIEVRSASVVGWRIDPSFDTIRDDPRFRALIREAGLEQGSER
jgi:tetratricopeptide (TPR) repeat protein